MSFDLSDYVPANERILEFYRRFPDGAIATTSPVAVPGRADLLMVQAIVYRSPDDRVPTTAWATEFMEGKTPYTKGREVENASTSAIGRALGYLGIGIKGGLASADEVREQRARQDTPQKPKKASVSPVEAEVVPEADPWAFDAAEGPFDLAESMAALEGGVPSCVHGPRVWKEGTSSAGKRWQAWMCPIGKKGDSCDPMWR